MIKKYLTLLEIIIGVIIISIIATIGMPFYRSVLERSKTKVCETNLRTLKAAIDIYGLENNVLPATLSQLDGEALKRAWAEVFRRENPIAIKAAYFLVDWDQQGYLYAQQGFVQRYLKGSLKYMTCPSDTTPPPQGISYGLNEYLKGIGLSEYRDIKKARGFTLLLTDCEKEFFSSLSDCVSRHVFVKGAFSRQSVANSVLVNGTVISLTGNASSDTSLDIFSASLQESGVTDGVSIDVAALNPACGGGQGPVGGQGPGCGFSCFWDALVAFLQSLWPF